MSGKAERQLKELRRLMPWNWDARVELHPPGEKAMHDFEDVLNYSLEQRRRRAPKPSPSPGRLKAVPSALTVPVAVPADEPLVAIQKQACKRRLSPAGEVSALNNGGPDSEETHNGNGSSQFVAPPSTARHPAVELETAEGPKAEVDPAAVKGASGGGNTSSPQKLQPVAPLPISTPATITKGNMEQSGASRELITPAAPNRRTTQAPASVPSSALQSGPWSDNRPALEDGHFHPTPMPTPRTVVATAQNKTAAGKKGGTNSSAAFRSPLPRTVFVQKKRRMHSSTSTSQPLAAAASAVAPGPLKPAVSAALPPLPRLSQQNPVEHQPVNPPVPTPGAKGVRNTPTRPNPAISSFVIEREVLVSPPEGSGRKGTSSGVTFAAVDNDLVINLDKYGKGPVITRPPSCPPLFKTMAPPRPSAQKNAQATALNNEFFMSEKGLLALLHGSAPASIQKNVGGQASAQGVLTAPTQSSLEHDRMFVGPQLSWACQQLARQRQ